MAEDTKPRKQASPARDRYGRPYRRSRWRDLVTDVFDDVIFSFALRDAFPDVRFECRGRDGKTVPDLATIAHGDSQVFIYVPIDYSVTDDRPPGPKRAWPAEQQFQYFRSYWSYGGRASSRWPFDFPYLEEGCLSSVWYLENPAALMTVRKVFHLLTRVTTGRVKSMYPRKCGHDIASSQRHGHHALLWCAQKPDRIIGHRRRPADGWSVPKSKWYRELWQRVIDEYGEDFADPELDGPMVQFIGADEPFRCYPGEENKPDATV